MTEQLQHKVIILEGPAGSGKDVMCDVVHKYAKKHMAWAQPELCSMAANVKKAVHALFNIFDDPGLLNAMKDKDTGLRLKDMPHRDLPNRMTPRAAYIWMIEDVLRDRFGEDILGVMMADQLRRSKSSVHIFNGIGHLCELEPILSYVGARNVLAIKLPAVGGAQSTDRRQGVAGTLLDKYPKSSLVTIPVAFALDADRQMLKILCEGAVKRFLEIEEGE